MRDLRRKLLSLGNHFFERLKTANFSTACGTSTLKSLPSRAFFVSDVHLRPRKHFSRCTLDCGFKTSESPALRGFVGGLRALATAALYLVLKSNGLRHSKNLPVKFDFSPIGTPANIAKKLPPQRCSKPFLIAFFNFSHKRPTFAFTSESGYTLGFRRRIAHSGLHAETRGVSDGVVSLPSERFARFGNPARPGIRTANFAAFGPWSGALPKSAESLRDSDALMRVAVPRRRGPAGLRDPVAVSLAALMGFAVLVSHFVGTQKIERLFFSYSGAFFEPLFASIHARNLSFGTTIRLLILSTGNSLPCTSS